MTGALKLFTYSVLNSKLCITCAYEVKMAFTLAQSATPVPFCISKSENIVSGLSLCC